MKTKSILPGLIFFSMLTGFPFLSPLSAAPAQSDTTIRTATTPRQALPQSAATPQTLSPTQTLAPTQMAITPQQATLTLKVAPPLAIASPQSGAAPLVVAPALAVASAQVTLPDSIQNVEEASPTLSLASPPIHKAYISRRTLKKEELDQAMEFAVSFKMRNFDELEKRLANLERITPEEMRAKYDPLNSDYQKVEQWLKSSGFKITGTDPNHLSIFARGNIRLIQQVTGATFARVVAEGTEVSSAITAPSVPLDLAPGVLGFNGLQPHLKMRNHLRFRTTDAVVGFGKNSLTSTNPPYTPSQMASAYQVAPLYQSGVTGSGQSIAIVIDTFPLPSDLSQFWTTYGVNQNINNVSFIQAVSGTLPALGGEESLDAEWSSAMAPGAKIRIYAATSLDFINLDKAYQQVYTDASNASLGLSQMSMSYGLGEQYEAYSQIVTDHQYFAELAGLGVSIFAASGDDGSTPGVNPTTGDSTENGPLQVDSPACDPFVTGVGGTTLYLDSTGNASTETVWNNSSGATGGGQSYYFYRPAWQTGTGIDNSITQRLVPDVACDADPYSGAVVIINGASYVFGGTSLGTPMWAAYCSLFNQVRSSNGKSSLGQLQPYLYPLSGTANFRDITSGNNATAGSNGLYAAGVGYDETTGIGVPNVQVLSQTLAKVSAPSQVPGFATLPLSTTIAQSNPFSFNFVVTGQPKPTLSLTSGQLPPGLTFTASSGLISGTPTTLGTYTGTVTATNGSSSTSQNFSITVVVSNGVVISLSVPATLNEGDPDGVGLVSVNTAPTSDLTVQLSSSNPAALSLPYATVTIPKGATSAGFYYTIMDNLTVFGTETSTINAHVAGGTDANLLVTITDNKTTDNWSTFGNGQAHTGAYPGNLLGSPYHLGWSATPESSSSTLNQVVVSHGIVYATPQIYTNSAHLSALNALTGASLWQYSYSSSGNRYYSINPPTVYKGSVYVQQGLGFNAAHTSTLPALLGCFDATQGTVNWNSPFSSQWDKYLAPTVYQSVGVMMDGGMFGGLYEFDLLGNESSFTTEPQDDLWTPTYYNGTIYTWVGGTFNAINPANGNVLWTKNAAFSANSYDMDCTVPISSNIAFLNGNQNLTAINVSSQTVVWSVAGSFTGTPAVANGYVYVISGSQVLAYNASTGVMSKQVDTQDYGLSGQPVVANDSLVVSSGTNTYVYSLQNWSLFQNIPYGGPVSVAGNTLYLAGSDGVIRAFVPSTLALTLSAPNSGGLTSYGYKATGLAINPTLGFVPTTGTVLTLINNTSANPIVGTFSNLTNGSTLSLTYNGKSYSFKVSYTGGDGNDLTLSY